MLLLSDVTADVFDNLLGKHLQWLQLVSFSALRAAVLVIHPLKCPNISESSLWTARHKQRSDKSRSIGCDAKPLTYSPLDGVNRGAAAVGVVVALQSDFIGGA